VWRVVEYSFAGDDG
jgi:hypothetical protein